MHHGRREDIHLHPLRRQLYGDHRCARHGWGETKPGQAPTCTAAGYTSYKTCLRCGYTTRETIPALQHDWSKWTVTTPATCTTAGEEERTCSRCQETEKQTIAALDHAWSAYSFDETNHWRECTRAGCTTNEQAAHSFTRNTCEICNYAFYSEGLDYKDNGDTVTITGKGDCSDTSIYIPPFFEGKPVTEIGNYAFLSCASLKEIVIPEGVISIGSSAFNYCTSLKEVVIPQSVTSIGTSAFQSCTSLAEIVFPESVTSLSIDAAAFSLCTSLERVTLPKGVTAIGTQAFRSCISLTEIVIPEGVTTIGEGAFFGCDNLTTVYYRGNKEQWDSITIGSDNEALKEAEIKYNYKGE